MSSLENSLSSWEWVEYIAAAVVILGVVGEYAASFTRLPKNDEEKNRLEKLSTVVLIVGLVFELLGLEPIPIGS